MVFVRALINPKSRCGQLFFERVAEFELVVSREIVKEALEVIRRPELISKSPHFSVVNFDRVLACFEDADAVEPPERLAVCRDPADDKFVECALAGGAQYIVSEDNDLLVLREFKNIRIVNSAEFLNTR